MFFLISIISLAEDTISANPYAKVEYNYSATVNTGTIRYVQQNAGTYWNANYWSPYGSNTSSGECYSACVSMALSYIGVNHTAGEIVSGGRKWAQSGATVEQMNSVSSAVDRYINGKGKYSPIVIWIPYTSGNHWVVVAGRVSGNTYLIVDPWNGSHGSTWQATINGDSISYWGGTQSIGTKLQYYNSTNPEPQPTVNNPFGYLDSVTAEMGKITVRGWAADMDAPNRAIDVHFYTVKNGQREILGATTASLSHAGISTSYPALNNYHGYEATFDTGLSGEVQVEAYGINVGNSGSNVMLWESPKTVFIPKDTSAPTITNVTVADISNTGYTVTCDVSDNIGISSVQFPTWSHTNGQDDLVWHEGKIFGNKATCKINISDHKGDVNCIYQTDIYAYDKAGNCTSYINRIVPYIDATPPVISNVEIVDVSETGYTVKCKVTDDHSKIDRVQFPTWFENNNPFNSDWSWGTSSTYSGKLENGKYVFRVNISNYNNRIGKYHTDIYAYDECGNQSKCYVTETTIQKMHKHEYTSSIKKAATCTTPGIMLYTCKDNDDSYEKTIPATGHQHTELRNVKSATCGQEGYTGDTYCKDCNTKLSSGKSIAKKTHTWDAGKVTKGATCSAAGVKTYTCTVCKATKTESIAATGHQHTELRNVKSATCGQEGYTGDTFCKDCNTKLSSGKSIAKKAHTWDAGKITQKATCTAKGVKTFTCTVCQATKTEEVPVTGHGTRITKFAKNASCKTEGYTGDIYCQDCGILLEEGEVIQKTEHAWNDGKVTQDATCTEKGVKTYTCTVCQAAKTEEIPATGHGKTEVRNQKDATCKAEGYTGDSYCTVCNQKICAGKKIAKTAHSWDKGKITRQPTTAKTGIKTYTCTKCKTTRTETIAKLKVKKLAVGKIIKDKASNGVYKVLKGGLSVEFTKPITKKASVKIPDTIKAGGVTCKVTGISANAFKSNSSLKTISIGKNVTTIGNNAFYGCKKLNKITGGNSIAKIGEKAFANCGSLSSITIAGSVRSIGKQAFYNCKKLKSIVVKTVALTDKNIGAKAFSGTYVKPTVKVPAKQLKAYQKLLRSKGMSLKAKYVRFQISAFYKASGNYF